MQQARGLFVGPYQIADRRQPEMRRGLVLRAADLVHQHERIRACTVQQGQRHPRIARMAQAALTLDEANVALRGIQDQLLSRSGHKVTDAGIDTNAAAGDHDPRLSSGRKAGVQTPAAGRDSKLEGGDHLADVAVRPHGQDAPTARG
jgi:hypothetical protein